MRLAKSAPFGCIGLTETPNAEWAKAPPAPPLTASLLNEKLPEKNHKTNHTTKSEKILTSYKMG